MSKKPAIGLADSPVINAIVSASHLLEDDSNAFIIAKDVGGSVVVTAGRFGRQTTLGKATLEGEILEHHVVLRGTTVSAFRSLSVVSPTLDASITADGLVIRGLENPVAAYRKIDRKFVWPDGCERDRDADEVWFRFGAEDVSQLPFEDKSHPYLTTPVRFYDDREAYSPFFAKLSDIFQTGMARLGDKGRCCFIATPGEFRVVQRFTKNGKAEDGTKFMLEMNQSPLDVPQSGVEAQLTTTDAKALASLMHGARRAELDFSKDGLRLRCVKAGATWTALFPASSEDVPLASAPIKVPEQQ